MTVMQILYDACQGFISIGNYRYIASLGKYYILPDYNQKHTQSNIDLVFTYFYQVLMFDLHC